MSTLIHNATLLPLHNGEGDVLEAHSLYSESGKIHWIGPADQAPEADTVVVADGALVTPGLIDCHTHLIYAGDRSSEFERRLMGETYAQIARSGGGIMSTVKQTREASFEALYAAAESRLRDMLQQGVCTVEIKSGYGLDFKTEQKMLQVACALEENLPVKIIKTFLGPHALPLEYQGKPEAYIQACIEWLIRLAEEKLIDAVDVFIEGIAFTPSQVKPFLEKASAMGLLIKGHTEQLSAIGGAQALIAQGASSVDHIEYLPAEQATLLAQAGTVAVLLPGAFYALSEKQKPPIEAFRQAGVKMAVATDCNPGSSPCSNLPLALNMACHFFGLTAIEAFAGATCWAAKALGLEKQKGKLEIGYDADFLLWDAKRIAQIIAPIGVAHRPRRFFAGKEEEVCNGRSKNR